VNVKTKTPSILARLIGASPGRLFTLEHHYRTLRRDRRGVSEIVRKALSAVVVSVHRFLADACGMSASALTYYSLLSFVPVIALLFAIAKGFGVRGTLDKFLHSVFEENATVLDQAMEFAKRAIENARGGIITGIGIFILLWAVIRVLNCTETAMNRVWRIKKGRSIRRMFTDYLSILFIAPLLVVLGSGVNVFLTTGLETYLPEFAPWVERLLACLPYLLVWLLFIFLYMFMPATPVRFKHAFWAALVAGTLYQVVQWIYIRFQVGVNSYNAIYGSLAALPLLLVWVQLSWSIVLWGTELCYILRNRHFIHRDDSRGDEPWLAMIESALRVMKIVVSRYAREGGATTSVIARELKMNVGKLQIILDEMVDRHVLVIASGGARDDVRYLPARDFHTTTEADLLISLSRVEESKDEHWKERFIDAMRHGFPGKWEDKP
jgi:membrane protein